MPHQPTTTRSRRPSPGATGSSAKAIRTPIVSPASTTPIQISVPTLSTPSLASSSCRPSRMNSIASSPKVRIRQKAVAVRRVSASK